jgi:DNA-binding beta-propeller fold protein YncE
VNAGSDTVSVFAVDGSQLSLREIVPSAGEFPVSIAVHNDLAYVLNARASESVSGYQVRSGLLQPIPGSTRPLALDPAATPEFTSTPGQVGFSPDGRQLIVTTKGNGSNVDVFASSITVCSLTRASSTTCPAPCRSRSTSTEPETWC